MQRFTDLAVWQRSHGLVLRVYRLSKSFPSDERFGLTSQPHRKHTQLRRAVLSVPTNVAEGSKRQSNQEYARFLNIAEASLVETEYLLMVSRDLGYVAPDSAKTALDELWEIARMLNGLRKAVESRKGS